MSGEHDESTIRPRQRGRGGSRVMRYALVMFFGWTILGTGLVVGMHAALGPAAPPTTPHLFAAVGPAAPAARAAKPAPANTIVVAADAQGNFFLDAAVNGAPVRFLVDTGASLVALTPADARAAGLSPAGGDTVTISTAHGEGTARRASLRSLRIDQLELEDVPAVVMDEQLPVSLLGTSVLSRLGGYSIRDGILTLEW